MGVKYWTDEHEDTMGRLYTGKATEGDQLIAHNQLLCADFYEDVYTQLCELIRPFVDSGTLPGSVIDSVTVLLKQMAE